MRWAIGLSAVGLSLLGPVAYSQNTYRIVDDNGVVHIVDRVPPQLAHLDREVLNSQGIVIGTEQGEITAEERADMDRRDAQERERQEAAAAAAKRDRALTETYTSVDDIIELRDRRVRLTEGQIRIAEQYLSNLRKHLSSLQANAERYKNSAAASVPPNMALEITNTQSHIKMYETDLESKRDELQKLKDEFDADIARFNELKGTAAN